MLKNMSTIKKVIFGFLMFYMTCGLLYFFVFCWSPFGFVADILYKTDLNYFVYNDGVRFPLVIFAPEAFIIAAIMWLFFRKETSVLLRGVITVVPFWQLYSIFSTLFAQSNYNSMFLKILNLLPVAGFIAIFYFLFRELIRLFRQT